jgi:TRAP-type C4-dicarboxylate transport system permease large subunit
MNGSVGASVLGLSRVISPRLNAEGISPPTRDAVIAVASTLGVLVPPSLVLILLSDTMLSAHTLAVTQTGRADRVVNTQDIFHAALLPAGIFLVLCVALSWLVGRKAARTVKPDRLTVNQGLIAGFSLAALLLLLGGVAAGYFYAVEAAAMGAFTLLASGLLTRQLSYTVLRDVFHDAIAITGALFSLLAAATTFTLVLRILGTDRLVNNLVEGIPGMMFLPLPVCWP